jgi:hypothetical protein
VPSGGRAFGRDITNTATNAVKPVGKKGTTRQRCLPPMLVAPTSPNTARAKASCAGGGGGGVLVARWIAYCHQEHDRASLFFRATPRKIEHYAEELAKITSVPDPPPPPVVEQPPVVVENPQPVSEPPKATEAPITITTVIATPVSTPPQPKPPNVVPEEDLARRARHQEWLVAVRQFKNSGCETPSDFLNQNTISFMDVYKNFATQLSRFCHWIAFYDAATVWTKEGEDVSLDNFQRAITEANRAQAEKKKEKRRLVSLAKALGQPPPKKTRLGISPHAPEVQLKSVIRYRMSPQSLYPGEKKSMSGTILNILISPDISCVLFNHRVCEVA